MNKNYIIKNSLLIFFLMLVSHMASAQNQSRSFWTKTDAQNVRAAHRSWYPKHFESFALEITAMKGYLSGAPFEQSGTALRQSSFIIELPMPDGSFNRYSLVESPVMESGLAAAYPNIKTYAGQGIDDPTATIRFDVTQFGFHSYVLSANGTIYIDPISLGNTNDYIVYYKHDIPAGLFRSNCLLKTDDEKSDLNIDHQNRLFDPASPQIIGSQLRTYRLALAADGEYTQYFGGTKAAALAAMVTSINRVNGVYEREVGIHMNIILNDTMIIYTNPSTDPYTDSDGSLMLGQNQTTCDNIILSANYDIGHVFSTGGGGIASLGCVCNTNNKARGVTGSPDPVGDDFDIDFVVHEMGHQFGANHIFNSSTGGCGGGNRNGSTAFEVGSGSTIMSYAGLCDINDLQMHSDAYFHTKNFDEVVTFSQSGAGNTCAVTTSTGNNAPVLTMPSPLAYTIPYKTPFKLTASATDPDGDAVTYCWEEYDLGPSTDWNAPTGNAPLFRSWNPTTSGTRMFPKLSKILAPTSIDIGETMATYQRSAAFRCTARDNRALGGGVIHNPTNVTLTIVNTGVGFAITAPNTAGISWIALSTHTVTWAVAQTDVTHINTPNVNIYLSIDNGNTFPITIATGVPNNGSYSFTVPNNPTSSARIMVEGAGNIFFDINDRAFTITAPTGINENTISNNINLYPNPATSEFHYVVNTQSAGKCRITVNDVAGRMMKEFSFEKSQAMIDGVMDLSGISSGIYIVRFDLPEGTVEKKLVIE